MTLSCWRRRRRPVRTLGVASDASNDVSFDPISYLKVRSMWIDTNAGMIGIQLKGRLGNQMFQYATARIIAKSLGSPLFLVGNTLNRR